MSAAAATCCTRLGGTSTYKSGGTTRPVASSSRRESSWRMMRNEEGAIPDATPEWAPSSIVCAVSVKARLPRSDVVTQIWL